MTSRVAMVVIILLPLLTSGCGSPEDLPEVRLEQAVLLQERGEFEKAIRVYTSLDSELGQLADLDHNRGYCYEQLGLIERAVENYERCLTKDPQHLSALNNLAAILARQKKYNEAADLFTRIVQRDPTNVLALRNRGLCYFDAGRSEDALVYYNAALSISPDDSQTLFQRGNLRVRREELDLAIADYSAAIQSNTDFAHAWLNRGLAHQQLNHIEESHRDLQRASELDSGIVLAGMSLINDGPDRRTTEISVVPAPEWKLVREAAIRQLNSMEFEDLRILGELKGEYSAIIEGTRNGATRQIWVCLHRLPTAVFPIVAPASETSLLVFKSMSESESGLAVTSWREAWDPRQAILPAATVRIDLAEQPIELQLIPQAVEE